MRYQLILCLLLCSLLIGGCTEIKPPDSSNGEYSGLYAQSALEYNLFITKHLDIVAGQLNSRMVAIRNSSQSFSSTELPGAKESYRLLLEEINSIEATMQAKTYESTRETALVTLDVVKKHYEDYIKALEDGKDVSNYAGIFLNDYNEITGLSSLYNN